MVSVVTLSPVDRGFEFHSDQTKEDKIGIYFFSAKSAVLKEYEARTGCNQGNMPEWSNMSTVVSVSSHYKNPNDHVNLVEKGYHHHLIQCTVTCSCHDVTEM